MDIFLKCIDITGPLNSVCGGKSICKVNNRMNSTQVHRYCALTEQWNTNNNSVKVQIRSIEDIYMRKQQTIGQLRKSKKPPEHKRRRQNVQK